MSGESGGLDVWQSHRPQRPVKGTALLLLLLVNNKPYFILTPKLKFINFKSVYHTRDWNMTWNPFFSTTTARNIWIMWISIRETKKFVYLQRTMGFTFCTCPHSRECCNKVELSSWLTKHYAMKIHGEVHVWIHEFYLGTTWRWVVCFRSRSLYPRGKSPMVPTGWVGPRAGLDAVER
jgi:hypothetical protein